MYLARHLWIVAFKDGLTSVPYAPTPQEQLPPGERYLGRQVEPDVLAGKVLGVTFDRVTIADWLYLAGGFSGEVILATSASDVWLFELFYGYSELVVESCAVVGLDVKEFDTCVSFGYSASSVREIAHYLPEEIFVDSLTEVAVVDYNEFLIIESRSSDIGRDLIYQANWAEGIFVNTEVSPDGYLRLKTPFESTLVQLAGGDYHSLILTTNGQVWAAGSNSKGALGLGHYTDQNKFVYVMDGATKVAAGSYHTLILTKDGRLLTCGSNVNGQLGNGSYSPTAVPTCVLTDVKDISANLEFSAAVKSDGTLWTWGNNWLGQLGKGSKKDRTATPTQVLANAAMVRCGGNHVLALKNDGTVWVWGNNRYGQLGDGTVEEKLSPIQIPAVGNDVIEVAAGDCHSLALKADGTVWAWGLNNNGQLGLGDLLDRHYPTQITGLSNVVKIYARGNHSFAITSDGILYGWGCGDYGQLGLGSQESKATPTPIDTGVSEVSGGNAHTIYQKGQDIFAVGDNLRGQLGDGTNIDRLSPVDVFNSSSCYGYWESPDINLSQVYSYSSSLILWSENIPLGTSVLVETRFSDDAGANWGEWVPATNGGSVDVLQSAAGLTHALLKIRVTFNSASGALPQIQSLSCIFSAGKKPIKEAQHYLDVLLTDSMTDSEARNYRFDTLFACALSENVIALKLFECLATEVFSDSIVWNVAHHLPEILMTLADSSTGFQAEWFYVKISVIPYRLVVADLVGFNLLVVGNALYDLMATDVLLYPTLVSVDSLEYGAEAVDELDYFLKVG